MLSEQELLMWVSDLESDRIDRTVSTTNSERSFDARPCRDCTVGDLSQDLFLVIYRNYAIDPEIIAENHRTLEEQLASLRFYDLNSQCPTFAGTLLFGKNPLDFLPGAYIQFVRYKGTELTDDIQNEYQFSGDLLSVLRELDNFLSVQIQTHPESDSALHESMVSDYPLVALRELLMNAVMHRVYESNAPIRFYWFTDRVEIQSPGGLYGLATPENFPQQNDYRNPVVAEAMKTLGYVNKYARGVLRAQQALARNGNPPAEFIFQPTYVLAIIRQKTVKLEANG